MRMDFEWSRLQFMPSFRKSDWHINASTLTNIETAQRSLSDNEIVIFPKVMEFKFCVLEHLIEFISIQKH